MRIIYFGHYSALTGYGRACRDYCAALRRAGHDLAIVDWQSIPGNQQRAVGAPEPRFRELDELLVPWTLALGDDDVAIVHGTPKLLATVSAQNALPPGGRRVAMTTWETDTIPGEFVSHLAAHFQRIIVPSQFCRRAILDARDRHQMPWVDELVQVVPHTFDPDWWAPAPVSTPGPVNFYSVGAWGARKNHEAVIKAYLHAFEAHDPVRLTIISTTTEGQRVTYAFQSLLARSGLSPQQMPPIELIHEPLGDVEMRELLARQHVYVNASRGEGWGLSVFEAALLGQQIITPDRDCVAGGEDDYLRGYHDRLDVEATLTPCFAGPGMPIVRADQVIGEKTTTVPGMTARGLWREIDVGDLAQAMRHVPVRDVVGAIFREAQREWLCREFGYAAVAPLLIDALIEALRPR